MPTVVVRLVASVSRANDFSSSWSMPVGSSAPGSAAAAGPVGRTSWKRAPLNTGLSVT